jgi:hypothetical protein
LDDVESDLKMEVKGWKEKMKQGRLVVERPGLTQGCSADWQAVCDVYVCNSDASSHFDSRPNRK